MEKASESAAKVSSKKVKEVEIAKYQIRFCHFLLCFIQLNDFYTLILLVIFNEFDHNFVFACNFPGKLSILTMY